MCDPATAQRRLEELVEGLIVCKLKGPHTFSCMFDEAERDAFAALNAACLAEGNDT